MQFEALKLFCDVARYRSFSRAAASNHLTQSAASHVVHQLERRLGFRLIDRSTRPLHLTPPGRRRELTVLSWREEDMVLACPPGHVFAQLETIRPEHLDGEKVVGFDKDLDIRREIDRFMRQQGVAMEVELAFDNIESIKK